MRFDGPPWLSAISIGLMLAISVAARRNNINRCPDPCSISDSSHGRLAVCNETMLLDFALYTPLNRTDKQFTILACTSNATELTKGDSVRHPDSWNDSFKEKSVNLQFGYWGTNVPSPDEESIEMAIGSVQNWLTYGASINQAHIFGKSGNTVVGQYIGSRVQ